MGLSYSSFAEYFLPYELGEYIDHGASGRVFEAWKGYGSARTLYVCKRFYKSKIKFSALQREVALIQQAKNKHVVVVEGPWETWKEYQILIQPRADANLGAYLEKMEWSGERKKIFQWMWCLMVTLRDLHATNIYHRDIKPDNILIYGSKILLTDFGISFCTDGKTKNFLTTTQGSYKYEPPESQVANDEESRWSIGKEGDVFSLGCVFYEMLLSIIPPALEKSYRVRKLDPPDTYESILFRTFTHPEEPDVFQVVSIDSDLEKKALAIIPANSKLLGQTEIYFNMVVECMMVFDGARWTMEELVKEVARKTDVATQSDCCNWIRISDIPPEATVEQIRQK